MSPRPTHAIRIPPPLQGLFWGLSMWGVAHTVSDINISLSGQKLLGFFCISLGLSLDAISIIAFIRARTTVNPVKIDRASNLVTTGLYKISRNPMYLGLALILTGWAILLGNPLNLITFFLFIIGMNHLQIKPEEAALSRKFPDSYTHYKANVRRWI